MALGLTISSGSGGSFLPIVKYDARAGRIFRVDREDGSSVPYDITRNFKAVFDFENVEVGWTKFVAGTAPDFVMVPFGEPLPPRPSDEHKQGIRMVIKLSAECGGDCREIAGQSGAFLSGIDDLHTAYEAGKSANAGKLPVIVLKDTVAKESGSGSKKSTNYQPVFEITGWVKRPVDLGSSEPEPVRKAPASTGSTRAAPPAVKAPVADDEDFG